ncbi:MAG: hypothetical protein J6J41_01395 [Clostridia bacterium]|nr:hypothetical protein [Clostridia bacterium]
MRSTMNYRRFFWIVGLMGVVFLALHWILSSRLGAGRQEESTMTVTLNRLEEENKAMEAELRLVDTEDYIVSSAMTNYAFMNKNDLRFQFVNPEALYAYTESELKILMDEMAD